MNLIISKVNRIATTLLASAALVACGSGGNGSGDHVPNPVISVSPENAPLYVDTEITLSAANSTDQDGDQLSYAWSQPAGQAITLKASAADANLTVSFIADAIGTYTFTLTVSDGKYQVSTEVALDIVIDDSNEAPTFTSSAEPISVDENFAGIVHSASASDPEGDTLVYSLIGADSEALTIDSSIGDLRFVNSPDYENAADADGDNAYQLSLQVTDGKATISQDLTISVTDVDEAPSISSEALFEIAENTATETIIHTASASDPEGQDVSFAISGADATGFSIDPSSGALSISASPDYENTTDADSDNIYKFALEASDGNNTSSQTLSIFVTNVNEAPTITSSDTASLEENDAEFTYAVTASDVDADDTHTYSIIGGADKALFALDGAELSFVSAPDYETPPASGDNTYEVDLRATDAAGLYAELSLSITVTNVDEQPTFTSAASVEVAENTATASIVYTATASDPEGASLSYQIVAGSDVGAFQQITSAGNQGKIQFAASPDFESPADADGDNAYELTIAVSDGSTDSVTHAITISVLDENDNTPVITANQSFVNVSEGSADGTELGAVSATDDDDGTILQSWAITGGNTDDDFAIDPASGMLSVASGASLDFETKPNYTLELSVQDDDGTNTSDTAEVAITIANVNEAPTFTSLTTVSVDENEAGVIYTAEASDVDASDTQTYSIAGGAHQALFTMAGADLSFVNAPDYESGTSTYEVIIRVTDADGLYEDLSLSVIVENVNEAPSFSPTAYATEEYENSTSPFFAAEANDEDVGATITFSLAAGVSDNDLFYIDPSFGFLNFKNGQDYEANPQTGVNQNGTYEVVIGASDGELAATPNFTLAVTLLDRNEAPAFASDSAATEALENSTAVFYTVSTAAPASDQDAGDLVTYALVSESGDNALFAIDPSTGALNFKVAPDHEVHGDANGDGTYEFEISASDGAATSSPNLALSVTITDEPEAPTFASAADSAQAPENSTAVFYTAAANDEDDGDSLSYSLLSTGDYALFSLDDTSGELSFGSAPDFENPSDSGDDGTYNVSISASDGGNSATLELAVTVTDANDAPTFANTSASVDALENSTEAFYTALAGDQDGDSLSYTIAGGADALAFAISNSGALSLVAAQDREAAANDADSDYIYQVEIAASDAEYTTTANLSLAVTLVDVNEAPTVTNTETSVSVLENTGNSAYVAFAYTITATDPEGDTVSFVLEGDDAGAFAVDSSTGAISFKSGLSSSGYDPDHEAPVDANGDNIYELNLRALDSSAGTDLISNPVALQVSVIDVSTAPTFIDSAGNSLASSGSSTGFADSRELAENASGIVYTAITLDDDGPSDPSIYSLGGVDAAAFTIDDATGELSFAADPDYDAPADQDSDNVYWVEVSATDSNSETSTLELGITITNLNDSAPAIADQSFSVDENAAAGAIVGTVAVSDADADSGLATTYQNWQITTGDSNGVFAIGADGTITVPDTSLIDFESVATSYSLSVSVSDGANTGTGTVTVNITNSNDEAPVVDSASYDLAEDASIDHVLGTLSATDPEDSSLGTTLQDWTITAGNGDAIFGLDSSSGDLSVASTANLDYETGGHSYALSVTVSDGANSSAAQTISITIIDVNDESPVITESQTFAISEESLAGAQVGTVAYSDADDPAINAFTWSIESGNTNSAFAIDPDSGIITVNDADQLTGGIIELTIRLEDGGGNTTPATATVSIDIKENILPDDFDAAGTTADITLSWSAEPTDHDYVIYRSSDSACDLLNYSLCAGSALINPATSPTVDSAVSQGVSYYYWLEVTRSTDNLTQVSSAPIRGLAYYPLNDTGVNWAGNVTTNSTSCSSNISGQQDCHHGRDVTANNSGNGLYGFDFTRLNNDGSEYAGGGDYSSDPWHCVRDNVTGLIWEVKSDDPDSQHYYYTRYRWGGQTSVGRGVAEADAKYTYTSQITTNSYGTYYNDWDELLDAANNNALCGFNDWRVPSIVELQSIVDYGDSANNGSWSVGIDENYFPNAIEGTSSNSLTSTYWTNMPKVDDTINAIAMIFHQLGTYSTPYRSRDHMVRLVRADH